MSIDTLKVHRELLNSGLTDAQADAIVRGLRETEQSAVTSEKLQSELAPIRSDLLQLKWGVGVIVAGVVGLILKAFFHG